MSKTFSDGQAFSRDVGRVNAEEQDVLRYKQVVVAEMRGG